MGHFISVIIPVYNEPAGLKDTVDALLRQDYPKENYEIIIVDNGSTDDTYQLACDLSEVPSVNIKALQEAEIKGSYAARNRGIKAASGDILCFIDADVTMQEDYLTLVDRMFEQLGIHYLGCNVKVQTTHETLSAKHELLRAFPVEGYINNRQFAPTCCLSVRKGLFDKVGLFDQHLESGGDMEFGRRVHRAGIVQTYSDDIVVYHPARWRYSALVAKARRCARGYAQLYHSAPHDYAADYWETLSLKKFLPRKPLKLQRRYRAAGIDVGLFEAFILAFLHIPLKGCAALELIRETIRLKQRKP